MKKSPNIEKMAVSKSAARYSHLHRKLGGGEPRERRKRKKIAHKKIRKSYRQQIINFLKGEVNVVVYNVNYQVGARDV